MSNAPHIYRDAGQLLLLLVFITLFCLSTQNDVSSKELDEVKQLPGLTFDYPAKQYAGYLQLSSQNNLHYWFLESQNSPSTDPLIIWISGGPGCSSLFASFTELGPFFLNPDGKTLFENVYSWNKLGNMLFFDNPTNVGFSYPAPGSLDNSSRYNDDATAEDNAEALQLFLARFPEYQGREFYVMGESYSGIYIAVLTKKLIQMLTFEPKQLNLNLVGLAIGNGLFSMKQSLNSYVNMAFYRGMIGKEVFDLFKTDCCAGIIPIQDCDFSAYVNMDGKLSAKQNDSLEFNKCAEKILAITKDQFYGIKGSKIFLLLIV